MTSRERILAAIRREPVDRVPVSPFGFGHLNPREGVGREMLEATDPFIPVGAGGGQFMGTRYGEHVSAEQDGSDTVTTIRTPKGDLKRVYRRTSLAGYTVKFPCATREDIEALLSIPFEAAHPNVGSFLDSKREYGEQGLVLAGIPDAICFLAEYMSPEDFCLLWALDPEFMEEATNTVQSRLITWVDEASAGGVDAYRIVGAEYITEQLGPKAFGRLGRDQDAELVDVIHKYDGIAYYHCHGKMDAYIEDIVATGIDALDPIEVEPYGDITIGVAKQRVGEDVCLVGGLDDMEVLETRDRATVLRMGEECLQAAGPTGYCLAGTASGTFTEPAARNFMALVEVAEQFAR
jgi:uroporphyrinogen-III decarboxylase